MVASRGELAQLEWERSVYLGSFRICGGIATAHTGRLTMRLADELPPSSENLVSSAFEVNLTWAQIASGDCRRLAKGKS